MSYLERKCGFLSILALTYCCSYNLPLWNSLSRRSIMTNKRKKETDQMVNDCLSKATTSTMASFEIVAEEIKAKRAKTVETVAKKTKETKKHLETFTKEKLSLLEKCGRNLAKSETGLIGALKSTSAFSAQISQMDKKLVDMSAFVGQINLEFKTALQGLDTKM